MQIAERVRAALGHYTEVLHSARRVGGVGDVHDELNLRARMHDLAAQGSPG